jgi:biopolymer transport protein ExbD
MGKAKYKETIVQDLDLAPIMNLCMILIPLLLLSAVFVEKGIIDVNVPTSGGQATAAQTDPSEEILPPQLVLMISSNGFYLRNQNGNATTEAMFAQYAAPLAGCPAAAAGGSDQPPTVCLTDAAPDAPMVERLNWAGLYNRLVEIRTNPQWFEKYNEEGAAQLIITADASVPFAVIVKAMDTSRYFVRSSAAALEPPAIGGDMTQYQLGGGSGATNADLDSAVYVTGAEDAPVGLFPFAAIGAPQSRN